MNKNFKAIVQGVIIAILIGFAIVFVRIILTSSYEKGALPNQVNIIIPNNQPKPTVTHRENIP